MWKSGGLSVRGQDSNLRPLGYEPNELPTAPPRVNRRTISLLHGYVKHRTEPIMGSTVVTREAHWAELAQELGGTYHVGGIFEPECLTVSVPPWHLVLTIEMSTPPLRTRVQTHYLPRRSFWFSLERDHEGTYVTTSDPVVALDLIEDVGYRRALRSEYFSLTLAQGAVSCDVLGTLDDKARLLRLLELVAETLQRLRDLGAVEG